MHLLVCSTIPSSRAPAHSIGAPATRHHQAGEGWQGLHLGGGGGSTTTSSRECEGWKVRPLGAATGPWAWELGRHLGLPERDQLHLGPGKLLPGVEHVLARVAASATTHPRTHEVEGLHPVKQEEADGDRAAAHTQGPVLLLGSTKDRPNWMWMAGGPPQPKHAMRSMHCVMGK